MGGGGRANLVKAGQMLNPVYAQMKVPVTARTTVRLIVESEVRIPSFLAPVPMAKLGQNLIREIDLQKQTPLKRKILKKKKKIPKKTNIKTCVSEKKFPVLFV